MKAQVKTRWIEALRSGEYKQGIGALRNDKNEFCCLGVLCNVIDQDGWEDGGIGVNALHRGYSGIPSPFVLDDVGMPERERSLHVQYETPDGREFNSAVSALTNLNDKARFDFTQIADWIEVNL